MWSDVGWTKSAFLPPLIVLATGCQTWKPTAVAPPAMDHLITDQAPSSIRITLTSGERLTLEDPIATADSIFDEAGFGNPNGYALEDLTLTEVRGFSPTFTALTAVAAVGLYLT